MKMRETQKHKYNFYFCRFARAVEFICCGVRRLESGKNNNVNANTAPRLSISTTAQAIVQQIPTYFEATGNLASDAQTDVAPAVGGKIVAVNFDIGSYVQQRLSFSSAR